MAKYYHIAALKRDTGIRFSGNEVRVDLDAVYATIENDEQLFTAVHPDTYFYLSGGGTLLLNNRYLLVVQRDETAKINPGLLSLFTGRADNEDEWISPPTLVRELFEELELYEDGERLRFVYPPLQSVIDNAQSVVINAKKSVSLSPLHLHSHILAIQKQKETVCSMPALLHINERNDINVIQVFSATLDLERIVARDRETEVPRMIAAIDLQYNEIIELSRPTGHRRSWKIEAIGKTSHLKTLLAAIEDSLVQTPVIGHIP